MDYKAEFKKYLEKGLKYHREGNYTEAIHYLDKAIEYSDKVSPNELGINYLNAYGIRGEDLYRLENYDAALRDCNHSIISCLSFINPDKNIFRFFSSMYNLRGHIYYDVEFYEAAVADFYSAIEIYPDSPHASLISSNISSINKEIEELRNENIKKDFGVAIRDLNKSFKQYFKQHSTTKDKNLLPAIAAVCVERGEIYYKMNFYESAIGELIRSLNMNPDSNKARTLLATIHCSRGENYYKSKKYDEAIEDLRKALSLDKSSDKAYELLNAATNANLKEKNSDPEERARMAETYATLYNLMRQSKLNEKTKSNLENLLTEATTLLEANGLLTEDLKPLLKTDSSLKKDSNFEYIRIDSGIEIKKYTGSATSVDIPSQIDDLPVTSIGKEAFKDCKFLKFVQISNSVTTIGEETFRSCISLKSIQIPNSVTSIGKYAFDHCESLTSIQIPNSVISIGDNAFSFCGSLKSIQIPNSVTTIGEETFRSCISLTSIQIPNSVTTIGYNAFAFCHSLKSIQIPNSVTSIGEETFRSCISLKSIQIPNSVTTIGDYVFAFCNSLTSIQIPNSVTTIGNGAFYLCKSLTRVIIPNSVTHIGDSAFAFCNSLTSVRLLNPNTVIGKDAFKNCSRALRIVREPVAEPVVKVPKITVTSYDKHEENVDEYFAKAKSCFVEFNYKEAVELFSKVIELKPNDSEAYGYRGLAYSSLKDYDSAINDLNRAIELNPTSYYLYFSRSGVYRLKGEDDKASADEDMAEKMLSQSNKAEETNKQNEKDIFSTCMVWIIILSILGIAFYLLFTYPIISIVIVVALYFLLR